MPATHSSAGLSCNFWSEFMFFKNLAAVSSVLVFVCATSAQTPQECTRPNMYVSDHAILPIPLDLIAVHPIAISDEGPRLIAPSNFQTEAAPRLVRAKDMDVRLASNVVDGPVAGRDLQVHDLITVVNDDTDFDAGGNACNSGCNAPVTMVASVTEILPNGKLVITGCNQTLHADEICERNLSGTVSPGSISADRRVHQHDLADLRISVRKFKFDSDKTVRPASAEENSSDSLATSAAKKIMVLREKEAQLAHLQFEVNKLRTEAGAPQQIMVKVQMLEVSLTKMRQMGIEFSFLPGTNCQVDSLSDVQKLACGGSGLNAEASSNLIDWLCENDVAKVLARPNIVVASGRPAQFCIGSEIPVPARNESEAAVEFQKIGTQLDLVACALGENRVRMEIRTRVSELDEAHQVRVGNSVVPAFTVRQLDTAIESKFGQSAMLSGAIQNRTEAVRNIGTDGTSEIEDRNNEIALLVIVTPEAVDSMAATDHAEVIKK